MNTQEVLTTLKKLGKPQTAAINRRHGAGDNVFGVLTSDIARLQKKIKVDHTLAMELWKTGNTEARVQPDRRRDHARLDEVTERVRSRDGVRTSQQVDHGETNCKTPDAVSYIAKASQRTR